MADNFEPNTANSQPTVDDFTGETVRKAIDDDNADFFRRLIAANKFNDKFSDYDNVRSTTVENRSEHRVLLLSKQTVESGSQNGAAADQRRLRSKFDR